MARIRAALATGLLLAGCADTDPYLRPGQWQPGGVNALNLATMVADKRDLVRGRGTTGSPGIEAAPPVARLWSGRATALPSTSSQAQGAGQGRAAAPTGGDGQGGT